MTRPGPPGSGRDPAGSATTSQLLSGPERHLALRFSYGPNPSLRRDLRRLGSADWFAHQLKPGKISDKRADELASWWPSLGRTPQDLWQRTVSEVEPGWQVMQDYQRWVLMRRVVSQRQVLEVMTEFW